MTRRSVGQTTRLGASPGSEDSHMEVRTMLLAALVLAFPATLEAQRRADPSSPPSDTVRHEPANVPRSARSVEPRRWITKGMKLGAAVGSLGGASHGAATADPNPRIMFSDRGTAAIVGGLLGAVVGATVGGLVAAIRQ